MCVYFFYFNYFPLMRFSNNLLQILRSRSDIIHGNVYWVCMHVQRKGK